MKKICLIFIAGLLLGAVRLLAQPVCIGEMCYPSEEEALAAGHSAAEVKAALAAHGETGDGAVPQNAGLPPPRAPEAGPDQAPSGGDTLRGAPVPGARLALGYMEPKDFVGFLRDRPPEKGLEDHSLIVILLLVLVGGLAANLTPCVLPLVPINLVLVGRGWKRGAAYGLGIALAYGSLGLAATFGGLAFGRIQSSPWFSAAVAVVFTVLGLAMSEVFFIDFSKYRVRIVGGAKGKQRGLIGVFLLGVGSAVLAGACVEPILLATLLLTAKWVAAGKAWAVVLPFILGLGMGLPWPFAAAGFSVLPKPGAWMKWVNRVFALMFFLMAAWYGRLAWLGFSASRAAKSGASGDMLEATPETFAQVLADARATGRPVVVDIWATWCKNCLAMESRTFRDASVQAEMENFAVIRLQAEDLSKLAKIGELAGLDFKGIPAFVVLPPAGGVRK